MVSRHCLCALVVGAVLTVNGCAPTTPVADNSQRSNEAPSDPQDQGPPSRSNPLHDLPAAALQAWGDAGGTQRAWIQFGIYGSVYWTDDSHATVDDIPAFVFVNGVHIHAEQPLPDPGIPFGVIIRGSENPDRDIAEFVKYAPHENLVALDLRLNALTDSGVKELTRLSKLQALSLRQTGITDEMLAEVESMKELTRLDVGDASSAKKDGRLTEKGIAHIGKLPKLAYLNLTGSGVKDADLKGLASLEHLKGLCLFRTYVTARGLDTLVQLNDLQHLHVQSTGIRDEAGALVQMKSLKTLHLQRSFNPEELEKVRQALPECEISQQ